MWRAMSSLSATRESLTFTMTFPPIAEITVISAPFIIPRLPRNLLVPSDAAYYVSLSDSRKRQRHHFASSHFLFRRA